MNNRNQHDKKRKLIEQQNDNNDDAEQIEKTLQFFDAILDEYICDYDVINENKTENSFSPTKSSHDLTTQQQHKQSAHGIQSSYTNISQDSGYRQAQNIPSRFQRITSTDRTNEIRRHISETSLNEVPTEAKPITKDKLSRQLHNQITTTSTEDLLMIPLSRQFPILNDRTNYLLSNNVSASLIDLTSIDRQLSKPRYRFVPPSASNLALNESEPIQTYDQYYIKTIQNDQAAHQNLSTHLHKIVKPTVIMPSIPKDVPVSQLAETNIHHENGKSAFKPARTSKNLHSSNAQQSSSLSNVKRVDAAHVGMANSHSQTTEANLPVRQKQSISQCHQSMLNLSSKAPSEKGHQQPSSSYTTNQSVPTNLTKKPSNSSQSNKTNGYNQHSYPSSFDNPIAKRIQQVNNASSIHGLVHSSYNQAHPNTAEHRSQQPTHPYGSYIPMSFNVSQTTNGFDHVHYLQAPLNSTNTHKYNAFQHSTPIQPTFHQPTSSMRNSMHPPSSYNIYHFNQNSTSRDGQSNRNSHRKNVTATSYL